MELWYWDHRILGVCDRKVRNTFHRIWGLRSKHVWYHDPPNLALFSLCPIPNSPKVGGLTILGQVLLGFYINF